MPQRIELTSEPVRRPRSSESSLIRKIQRACRSTLPEPDLGLNLDVSDYINSKQGVAPREAVLAIEKLINSGETQTAVFALSLLDVLVKNCGYSIHLQISRKEFLNDLVKRFPEHPPLRYSKVQQMILEAIEEWYQTICKHASYKDDLQYISDMHKLLKYKGYIFPKVGSENLAVMRPNDQLRTPNELQEEQEIAQAAKLEELLRSGKPDDLKEANKLMKVMAGFKDDTKIAVKQAINNELNKLKRKADLFNEMLTSTSEPDLNNETIQELYGDLRSAQPKFEKLIEEEHDDDTLVSNLLKFNDLVVQLLEKYRSIRGLKGEEQSGKNVNESLKEFSLIDFDDDTTASVQPELSLDKSLQPSEDLLDDLTNLSLSSLSKSPENTSNLYNTGQSNFPGIDLLNFDLPSSETKAANPPDSNSFYLLSGLMNNSNNATETLSQLQRQTLNESDNLKIDYELVRKSPTKLKLIIHYSNLSSDPITNVALLLASPKSTTLSLQPQSGNFLQSKVKDGIKQVAFIEGTSLNSENSIKLKWKATYNVKDRSNEESGMVNLPKI
ncbi:Gga1p [Saccharomyces cerevisiae x Saccharomyces kudriavzevii VIN7]|uniref:Gga1p n=1 Tax=Saccharomyces cerevisiae x Saccharomyces kudriavzevii (strain VIN7) TaxID=1095631 RepID=H0GT81_SACCK|nr:Gga1p [Saccharomyces cerevisiae x Saccharomyces kudriavzevii VIN7]